MYLKFVVVQADNLHNLSCSLYTGGMGQVVPTSPLANEEVITWYKQADQVVPTGSFAKLHLAGRSYCVGDHVFYPINERVPAGRRPD